MICVSMATRVSSSHILCKKLLQSLVCDCMCVTNKIIKLLKTSILTNAHDSLLVKLRRRQSESAWTLNMYMQN